MAGAGGVEVGRAAVRVVPDTGGFAQKLKRELDAIEDRVKVKIKVDLDTNGLSAKVRAAAEEAERLSKIRPEVDPDTDGMRREVEEAAEAAEKTSKIKPKVDPETSGLIRKVRDAVREAQTAAGDIDVKMNVHSDLSAMAGRGLASMTSSAISLAGTLARVGSIAAAATVAIGGITPALAAATAATWQFTTASSTLLGGVLVTGAAGAAMAFGTLKMAVAGMGDALKASNPGEFSEAIAKIPPAAQSAARAMFDLKGAFSGFGAEIQQSFWEPLSNIGQLSVLVEPVKAAMQSLAGSMGRASAGLVDFVTQGAGLAAMHSIIENAATGTGRLADGFAASLKSLVLLGGAAAPIFTEMSNAAATWAEGMAEKMQRAYDTGALQAKMESAVDMAKSLWGVLTDLGGIVAGVGRAAMAATGSLGGAFATAAQGLNELVNSARGQEALIGFFTSMQAALQAIIPLVGQVATIIGGTLAPALSGAIQSLAPVVSQVLGSLNAALQAMIPGFQALVQGLAQGLQGIIPAIQPLGAAFGGLMSAIAPLIPAIGQFLGVIGGALAAALSAVTPLISSLSSSFSAIGPVILTAVAAFAGFAQIASIVSTVTGVISSLGTVLSLLTSPIGLVVAGIALLAVGFSQTPGAMEPLKAAFMQIVQVVQQLLPVLMQVGQQLMAALMPAITALIPVIVQIVQTAAQIIAAVAPILAIVLQLAATIIGALMPVITSLMPIISALVSIIGSIVTALAPVLQVIAQVIAVFAQLLATIIGFVASALGMILSFVAGVISGFVSMAASVIGAVTGFVSGVISHIASMASSVMSAATRMWSHVVSAFSSGVSQAVSWVGRLPGMAVHAMGNVGSLLVSSGKALIQGFINGIKSMIGAVADAARSAVQAAKNFFPHSPAKEGPFSGRGWVLYSGESIGEAFSAGIRNSSGLARAATKEMMSAASANLSAYKGDAIEVNAANNKKVAPNRDYSVNIGTIVAADPNKPIRDAEQLQLKARIRGGLA